MISTNSITGDSIRTKGATTDAYRDSWERIFGNKEKKPITTNTLSPQWVLGANYVSDEEYEKNKNLSD